MSNIQQYLSTEITKVLHDLYQDSSLEDPGKLLLAEVSLATQKEFGHYQCNNAMRLAKALKKNPREIALAVIDHLKDHEAISKVEVAGPGFINITLSKEYLSQLLTIQLNDDRLGVAPLQKAQKVVVDFSSPNVAKELHVGHLRSTIIGDSIARLLEFLGYDVLRINHVGDFGTQFGMLIEYLKEKENDIFSGKKQAQLPQLMQWYKESKQLFDLDPHFKKQAQLAAKKLQQRDPDIRKAWETICAISRKAYEEIYHLLDIDITERGESFYEPFLQQVVDDLEKKGLVTDSDGAKCIFLDGYEVPIILQKSDGAFNYSTTDLAALWHRSQVEKAERILYVVDLGQKLHLDMIFEAAKKAGYIDANQQVKHVGFGVVLGSDGKKFKTRSGETEKLIDLIQEGIAKAQVVMEERLQGGFKEEIASSAQILGIDAIKYADLSSHRTKDYVFSYDKMLNFEGNTAAFLLYSYVRIQSIKRKANISIDPLVKSGKVTLTEPAEIDLGLHLLRFVEALHAMDVELLPNRLCEYLFNLAEIFNLFFRDCQVVGSEQQTSRLLLCELTSKVFEKGFSILGLKTLDRM